MGDTRKQLKKVTQEHGELDTKLQSLTEEGRAQKTELEKKVQLLSAEQQKIQQERESQTKELMKVKEALSKTSTALKERQSQSEAEKKSSETALEEKVNMPSMRFRDSVRIDSRWTRFESAYRLKRISVRYKQRSVFSVYFIVEQK